MFFSPPPPPTTFSLLFSSFSSFIFLLLVVLVFTFLRSKQRGRRGKRGAIDRAILKALGQFDEKEKKKINHLVKGGGGEKEGGDGREGRITGEEVVKKHLKRAFRELVSEMLGLERVRKVEKKEKTEERRKKREEIWGGEGGGEKYRENYRAVLPLAVGRGKFKVLEEGELATQLVGSLSKDICDNIRREMKRYGMKSQKMLDDMQNNVELCVKELLFILFSSPMVKMEENVVKGCYPVAERYFASILWISIDSGLDTFFTSFLREQNEPKGKLDNFAEKSTTLKENILLGFQNVLSLCFPDTSIALVFLFEEEWGVSIKKKVEEKSEEEKEKEKARKQKEKEFREKKKKKKNLGDYCHSDDESSDDPATFSNPLPLSTQSMTRITTSFSPTRSSSSSSPMRLYFSDLPVVLNYEMGRQMGTWFGEILKMDEMDQIPIVSFFEGTTRLPSGVGGEWVGAKYECLSGSEDVAEILATHIKKLFHDEVMTIKGVPFFETLDAIGNQLVTGKFQSEEIIAMDSDPLPGRGSLNADVVAIDPFALATKSQLGLESGRSSEITMRNATLIQQLADISEKMAKCAADCQKMGQASSSPHALKRTHDRLKQEIAEFTESCQRLEEEAQIIMDVPVTEPTLSIAQDTMTEAARMDAHRLKGQHYELLEENLPKVIAGLKTAKLLAQVLAGNSDGETPLIWVAAKVLQNKKLKELTPEIEDVQSTLELAMNGLIIFRSTAKVVLESCAEHLPHLVKGVTALAEYVIDAYTLEGVRTMVGHEEDEKGESSQGANGQKAAEEPSGIDLANLGLPDSPKQPFSQTFTDKSFFRMGKTFTEKIFKALDKNGNVNLTKEKLITTLRRAMMKDIVSVGFLTIKDTSLDISDVEKEILQMCATKEQGARLSQFISMFSVAVSKTVEKIAEKMEDSSNVWNRRDFIPEVMSECVAFFLFSDISSIGLKWSDFILRYDPSVTRKRHHYEVVYQFFNIAHLTLKQALDAIQNETEESKLLNLDDVIPMAPSLISSTLLDLAQRCTSASRVINALRYKNSTRASLTLRIALGEEDERNFVSEQVDVGVTNLVKVSQDLSTTFKYVGGVSANVVANLQDPATFRSALQEILTEVVCFVTLRKDDEEIQTREMEKRLGELQLTSNFLNLLTNMAGTRSSSSWFSWSLEMLNFMKQEGRRISGCALSFMIPGAYLMVGKGAKLVKPTSVRRMGAKLVVGPLFDVQVKSNNYNYKIGKVETYVEKIREIQQLILELVAKVHAADSAVRQIEKSSHRSPHEREREMMLRGSGSISHHSSVVGVNRASLFTQEDRQAIQQIIPGRLNKELNDKTLLYDYEMARKKLLAAHSKRQREKGGDKWEEDKQFMDMVDPLYYECFLLSAVLLMKKEDLEVRLEALRKILVDSSHVPGKEGFHFSEDSLLMN